MSGGRSQRLPESLVLLAPALLMLLGTAVVAMSSALGFWVSLGPGPGFFPLVLGAVLVALSAAWGFQLWRAGGRTGPLEAPEAVQAKPAQLSQVGHEEPIPWRAIATIVVSLVLLAGGLNLLGFQLSMALFLAFHLRVVGRRGWLLTVVVALLGSFGVFSLFVNVLSISLPTSSLGLLRGMGL